MSSYPYPQNDNKGAFIWGIVAIALFLTFLAAQASGGCTVDDNTASRVLRDSGYTDIHVSDSPVWFECGGDPFASHFTAMHNGMPVEGLVCCGYVKACTVRF